MTDLFPGRAGFRQLLEWGYPQGALRPLPPADKAFSVVHITGNSRLPSAKGEIDWRANDPANQNSATFFVNRDGSIWQALGDPLAMDPWANGNVRSPDTSNPRIAAMVRDGVNANERTLVAIENVGYEPGSSITPAQEAADARIIAYYHGKAGVPVNRQTVIGHYQLNSIARPNCPGVNKALIDRIVALATDSEDDMQIPSGTRHHVQGVMATGTGLYDAPRLNASAITNRQAEFVSIFGSTEGDEFAGSTEWLLVGWGGRFRYAHASLVKRVALTNTGAAVIPVQTVEVIKEVPTDCTPAIKAATDPLLAKLGRGKAAAEALAEVLT